MRIKAEVTTPWARRGGLFYTEGLTPTMESFIEKGYLTVIEEPPKEKKARKAKADTLPFEVDDAEGR